MLPLTAYTNVATVPMDSPHRLSPERSPSPNLYDHPLDNEPELVVTAESLRQHQMEG